MRRWTALLGLFVLVFVAFGVFAALGLPHGAQPAGGGPGATTGDQSLTMPVAPPGNAQASDMEVKPAQMIGAKYLHVRVDSYTVPLAPDRVEAYYAPSLLSDGFKETGSGTGGSRTCNPCFYSWMFQRGQYDTAVLTVYPTKAGSRYSIALEEIQPPPRPQESYVPQDIVLAEITGQTDASATPKSATYAAKDKIDALRAIVNGLPLDVRDPHGCAMDSGARAEVTFTASDGIEYTFTANPACTSVAGPGSTALMDIGSTLYGAVMGDLGQQNTYSR